MFVPTKISEIRANETQVRSEIDQDTVDDYARAIESGERLPPVDIFHDEETDTLWLASGFHRLAAHRQAGCDEIYASVHQGSKRDALWFALAANKANGRRMSNADKRNAISVALHLDPTKSDNSIATLIGVDNMTVKRERERLEATCEIRKCATRESSDGRRYPAKHQISAPPAPEPQDDLAPATNDGPPPEAPLPTDGQGMEARRMDPPPATGGQGHGSPAEAHPETGVDVSQGGAISGDLGDVAKQIQSDVRRMAKRLGNAWKEIEQEISQGIAQPVGGELWRKIGAHTIQQNIEIAQERLKGGAPIPCECQGSDAECYLCSGSGFTTRYRKGQAAGAKPDRGSR